MSVIKKITRLGMAAVLCSSVYSAHGQAVFGSIAGTVQDASGAVVPNAKITVTDTAKGIAVTATSNASGEYTVLRLIPDPYSVKIEAAGFETFEQKGITVNVDTASKVDGNLQIGSASQVVEVRSDSVPALKTDQADVSASLSSKEIEDLPVAGRNVTGLQLLQPGAQQLGFSHAADENPQGSLQIQVDGQAFGGTAFELDGTDNQDPILGIIVINPNPDSLQDQKITTQNFNAEFGKAVASVVTEQTKSGSNAIHGSGFWYRESAEQLARDPFQQGPSQLVTSPFPQALRSQFGGSVGGPIKRDKAFFFLDYQGLRQKVGTSNLQSVPTANVVSTCLGQTVGASGIPGCDFSEYDTAPLQGGNNGRRIYDPANGSAPFPGNTIPLARVSPQAQNLFRSLQQYRPNTFTDSTFPGLRNNYAGSGLGLLNTDQWDERVDYQVKENLHVFERFSRFTSLLTGGTLFGAAGGAGFGLNGYGGTSNGANDSLAGGFDLAINSKLSTDFRVGYYRYDIGTQKYDQNVQLANQLGIPGLNTGAFITGGSPSFQLSDLDQTGNSRSVPGADLGPQYGGGLNVNRCNCPLTEREDQYQIVDNWTRTIGNHEIRFGGDLRYARNLRVPSDNDRTGVLQFYPGSTSSTTPVEANQGGISYATLALGQVSNFNRYVSTSTDAKEFQKRTFFFIQDTWHASPKLNVNYGLRYEFYFPEAINNPGQGGILDLTTGYIRVAGIGQVASNLNFHKPLFAFNPRFGLAYQLDRKSVVRAGYGRSFDIGVFGSVFGHTATQNLPILANQQIVPSGGQTSFAFNLADGPAPYQPVTVPANGLLPNPGSIVQTRSRPDPLRLPTLDAWNLSLQQSVTPTLSVTLAYVGNKGTHTLSSGDGNSTNPNEAGIFLPAALSISGQTLHYDPSVPLTATSPLQNNVPGISANGGTDNQNYLQRYYAASLPACSDPAYVTPAGFTRGQCGWANAITYEGDDQDTHYNALQISIAKQFTHGFSLNVNYAWQVAYNYLSNYATFDKSIVKGRDEQTREQSVVLYGIGQLPFGRDRFFLHNAGGALNEIIGGWQFSPIITWQGGLPFTLSYSSCPLSIPSDAPCYVNGPVRSLNRSLQGYPGGPTGVTLYRAQTLGGQFTAAPLDTVGNSGRNSVFGPNFFNGDLSLQKNFPIKERLSAQFRWDAYNGFNHINYGLPNGTNGQVFSSIESNGAITAGPYPNGSTNPRQQQFSVRLDF